MYYITEINNMKAANACALAEGVGRVVKTALGIEEE